MLKEHMGAKYVRYHVGKMVISNEQVVEQFD